MQVPLKKFPRGRIAGLKEICICYLDIHGKMVLCRDCLNLCSNKQYVKVATSTPSMQLVLLDFTPKLAYFRKCKNHTTNQCFGGIINDPLLFFFSSAFFFLDFLINRKKSSYRTVCIIYQHGVKNVGRKQKYVVIYIHGRSLEGEITHTLP